MCSRWLPDWFYPGSWQAAEDGFEAAAIPASDEEEEEDAESFR